jgi:hypothetical protein
MRLQADPRLPDPTSQGWPKALNSRLYELFRDLSKLFNMGSMWDTEGTALPTSGTWAQGDMCRNTAPAEAGLATAKYVITGWVCTVSGTPGTWLQMRVLTGN